MNIVLSTDQEYAISSIVDWFADSNKSQVFKLAGVAGSGKSTIATYLSEVLHKQYSNISIAYCALTGRASNVIRTKLKRNGNNRDMCCTIHSLIYKPLIDPVTLEITDWIRNLDLPYDLLIVDELSMVGEEIFLDLMSYNIPILGIGDHYQLPPINSSFCAIDDPDIKLEKIHRQAENNPIIKVSKIIREDGRLRTYEEYGEYGNNGVKRISQYSSSTKKLLLSLYENYDKDTVFLAGTNKFRVETNIKIRKALGLYDDIPKETDRVVCLKNNRKANVPIFNGVLGTIIFCEEIDANTYKVEIEIDAEEIKYRGLITKYTFDYPDSKLDVALERKAQYLDRFDYGYCITVHKMQGSEAKNIVLFERMRWKQESELDYSRWLYTGVTRAINNLLIVA